MCPYSVLFWSAFSPIRTEYGQIRSISPYSLQMQENADQYNSEQEHFLRSVKFESLKSGCQEQSKQISFIRI